MGYRPPQFPQGYPQIPQQTQQKNKRPAPVRQGFPNEQYFSQPQPANYQRMQPQVYQQAYVQPNGYDNYRYAVYQQNKPVVPVYAPQDNSQTNIQNSYFAQQQQQQQHIQGGNIPNNIPNNLPNNLSNTQIHNSIPNNQLNSINGANKGNIPHMPHVMNHNIIQNPQQDFYNQQMKLQQQQRPNIRPQPIAIQNPIETKPLQQPMISPSMNPQIQMPNLNYNNSQNIQMNQKPNIQNNDQVQRIDPIQMTVQPPQFVPDYNSPPCGPFNIIGRGNLPSINFMIDLD